jgi:hypothetical protein
MPICPVLSRRFLLASVLALATPLAQIRAEDEVPEADKIPQKAALYQTHPKGPQRCQICLQFNPPNTCKIVKGTIAPQGWCQYFAARENAQ